MMFWTETRTSREVRGTFLGRTCNRGLGVDSFLPREPGRVGDRELSETRLVFAFRAGFDRICSLGVVDAIAGGQFCSSSNP
jgi:hypothetical protein